MRAYTVVDLMGPHLDVGPTFETEEQAQEYEYGTDVWEVVSWIEDFDSVDRAYFLFRTDGIHEVSYVVAEDTTDLIGTSNEAAVQTNIRSEV